MKREREERDRERETEREREERERRISIQRLQFEGLTTHRRQDSVHLIQFMKWDRHLAVNAFGCDVYSP